MDPEKLLVKVSLGKKLTEEELQNVIDAFEELSPQNFSRVGAVDDAYALAHLLSRAGNAQQAYLIERYLEAKDPLLVSLVLETLCLNWNLSAAYLERVMSFALGESWDYDEDVRHAAVKILGEYLRGQFAEGAQTGKSANWFNQSGGQALELLFSILGDETLERLTRQAAYLALCRAAGKEWDQMPAEFAQLDFSEASTELDREMLNKLKEKLK